MLDQLRQVAIFAKTVNHGSFRGAARELRLSPSVVSHHISQLEQHLGVALLHRSTRKLALTPEGERLLASTQQMLESVEGAFEEIGSTASSPTGELRLTMPSVLIHSPLIDSLAAFSMKYPGINYTLNFSDERQDMISGGFDIAVRMGVKTKSSAATRSLFQVNRCLVGSKKYLNSRSKATKPEDLLAWDWIELAQVRHIKLQFRKGKAKPVVIKPTPHIAVNDAHALYRLAQAGAGLAVVPEFVASEDVESGLVEHVLPNWKLEPIEVFAAWPSNAPKHGLIKLLINEISPVQSLRE